MTLSSRLHVDAYSVLSDALEDATAAGLREAYAFDDDPCEDVLLVFVERSVLRALWRILRLGPVLVAEGVALDPAEAILEAVRTGIGYGVRRSFKHVEHPRPEDVEVSIEQELSGALCEVLRFGEE